MRAVVFPLVLLASAAAFAAQEEAQPPTCSSLADCRQMALDAAARQDYETFHTLAWRAAQSGPRNDASLMYLLARAQSLSGRPHDALIMLRRLAEMGTGAVEAETSDDFRRVRSLSGWPDVLETIRGAAAGEPAAPSASDVSADTRAKAAPPTEPAARSASTIPTPSKAVSEAVAIPATLARPVALDYDAVSRRFVFADESTETLKIVDELSGKAVNLVSRGWAGAYRTAALAIDHRRGDLWVAGADEADGAARSAVHRVQLVSGRLLYAVELPAEAGAARFTDVAMRDGSALFLDQQQGGRIYELTPGSKALRLHARLDDVSGASSLAPAGDTVIYIAHDAGISRLNPAARTTAPVKASSKVSLRGLQWIREYKGSLLGIQQQPDGSHAAVRIRLDRRGRTATSLEVLDSAASRAASIANDVFFYLASPSAGAGAILRRHELK